MTIVYKSTDTTFSKENTNYFKNNTQLLKEDNNSINETDFKNMIKTEIVNFMGRFDNIVLLAGAGASVVPTKDNKPDPQFGHTVDMLGNEVLKQLNNPKYFSRDKLSTMCRYNEKPFNLENFLSQLQSFSEFVLGTDKENFQNSYDKIIEIIIDKTSYNYDESKFKHGKLIKQLTDMLTTPNRLSIVTTNYDTVIEESAYNLNYTVFDGFTFSNKPIFDIDMFDWYLSKPISEVKSQKEAYKKSVINLLKIHGSLTWDKDGNDIVRRGKEVVKEPIMVFPSSNKYMQSYEKPYFELFSKFQELLRKPNTILITTGFSFGDNHISQMIVQALKNTPSLSLLVTDFNISPAEPNSNWKELLGLMDKAYNVAFLQSTLNTDLTDYFARGDKHD